MLLVAFLLSTEVEKAGVVAVIVGCLDRAFDLHLILVNDIAIGFGIARRVVHIPAEFLEERIKEITPKLRLVVGAGLVSVDVFAEACDKIKDGLRRGHEESGKKAETPLCFGDCKVFALM